MYVGHAGPPMKKKTSSVLILVIVIASVGFAVGLGILIFFLVRPRGAKVGEMNLTAANATTLVTAKVGDSLFFRADISMEVTRLSLDDAARDRAADALLSKSTLTVRATSPAGKEKVSTCAIYKGRAVSSTATSGTYSRSGMLNDCVIAIDQAGAWTVRASVVWAPTLVLRSASLETRRESPSE